jgi:hypothetical protein
MSKYQIAREVQKELEVLNKRIDRKILRGISYMTEARRHKMLLSQLAHLNRHNSLGLLGRLTAALSFRRFA